MAKKTNIYAILLAGGMGTRLWPLSRQLYPKQLVNFVGNETLIQSTITRMNSVIDPENIKVVCGIEHCHEIARHMKEIGISPEGKIIAEPCGRNTAPAILLAMLDILKNNEDAVLCVFPADHVIRDIGIFHNKVKTAISIAEKGYIVTFGIKPDYPETGYGYIESGKEIGEGTFTVRRFVEKPDKETAIKYIESGNFFWNSGMFTFKLSIMDNEFKKLQPDLYTRMVNMIHHTPHPGPLPLNLPLDGGYPEHSLPLDGGGLGWGCVKKEYYEKLPDISIDYAIMEKTALAAVLPSDFGWSDIGSWKSLYDFLQKDENSNIIKGDVIAKDTKNCLIFAHDRLVAANKIKNMAVIDTPDSVFISDMENSRDVKEIVNILKQKGRREFYSHNTVHFYWGSLTCLEKTEGYALDRITVLPGQTALLNQAVPDAGLLTLINGRAEFCINNNCQDVLPGCIINLSLPCSVTIHNPCERPVNVLAIRLRDEL